MKLTSKLNQAVVVAFVVTGLVAIGAILLEFPGLIDMQCSSNGCRVIIDGRSQP